MTRTDKTISEQQTTIRHYDRAMQGDRDALMAANTAIANADYVKAKEILSHRLTEIGMLK